MNGRKTGRKLISFILSLVMIISMVPMSAAAAPATDDSSTSANVSKVLSYAAQMRDANTRDDGGYTNGNFTWDTEGKDDSWRYFNGLMMDAFLMTGDESNVAYAEAFYNSNIAEDGSLNTKYYEGELDSIEAARGLFDLLDSENTEKYQLAIQYIYTQLENQTTYEECGGNYLHKQEDDGTPTSSWSDWNIGLDGLYMAEPFLMECANAIEEGKLELTGKDGEAVSSTSIYEAVYNRFKWVAENMRDAETGLYQHGWNVEKSEGNGHFWARGIGWYAMAQVDVIEMMPNAEYRSAMIAQLPAFFDAMLKYQDADSGMWYNVVNRGSDLSGNRLETSGSAMMAYALMKAYNNGYVSDAKYGQAGLAAFNGIVENKIQGSEGDYKVVDIYQKSGVGTSDEYYCTNPYTDDEAKGTGALIMAATLANTTAAALPDSPDSGDEDTSEPVKDDATGISVSGTSATAIAVEDKSDDANVKNALAEKLQDGFTAYDITLTGYNDGEEATVTMPAPTGANKVYYVSEEGTAEEITGATFEEGKVTFKTNHFSVYAVGAAKTEEGGGDSGDTGDLEWKDIPGGTYYERTQSMTTDGEYVILYQSSGASTSGRALYYSSKSDVSGQSVSVSSENGQYTISNIDAKTTWYIDANNRIYCINNGNNYYLYRNISRANLTTDLDDAIDTWVIVGQDNGAVNFNMGSQDRVRSLRWNKSDFRLDYDGGTCDLYLYEKHTSSGGQAALTGTLSYTVKTGNSLDEAVIKEAASVLYRENSDAAPTTIDWDKVSAIWDTALDTSQVGTYNMTVSYQGVELGTITVTVQEKVLDQSQPNWGLDAATDYPQYPNPGAVRINKTATAQDFNSTGVTNVELSTAGISVKQGVDVVLVVDVSNSMGWTDNWFEGMSPAQVEAAKDNAKIPKGDASATTDKLDQAMVSAQEFANILLGDNTDGSSTNNSLSFVTFAGFDADNTNEKGEDADYIDSVQTVFTNIQNASTADQVFAATKFTEYSLRENGTSVDYTLQIGSTNGNVARGINRGNTNYDYAFAEANKAVQKLQGQYTNYESTGRETIVLFMTDGAPSHYNGQRLNGDAADKIYGTNNQEYPAAGQYNGREEDSAETWLDFISAPNTYAQELYENIDDFYAVGFDLNHGGFGDYSWSEGELQPVLEGLAGANTVDVTLVETGTALEEFYRNLANSIKLAGTNAQVTDTIKSDFTLQTTSFGPDDSPTSPTITVTEYDLYTAADGVPEDQIGMRKEGTANVLETVTFNPDGTEAYSDKAENPSESIMSEANGILTINAQTFTYTKDADGVETFVWKIGDITEKEVALNYYAYLKGSLEGDRAAGVYDTNEYAKLEYVDIDGNYALQKFGVPKVSWQGAVTNIEYYLVNEKGQPVNNLGNVIPFANRVKVGAGSYRTFNLNDSLTVNGSAYVPSGYTMYNSSASYTVTANSDGTGSLVIHDDQTIVDSAEITTRRVDEDTDNYASTTVAFAVLFKGDPVEMDPLTPDQIVIDYGKAVQADVTANDAEGSTYKALGFMQYNADTDVSLTQLSDGAKEFNGDYGQFTIADNGKVQYKLNKMLSAVEKIFVVVEVKPSDGSDSYRMLNELDVIPATSVYYETDFADGVFTYAETDNSNWVTMPENGTSDKEVQNDGTIGHNAPYGYDDSYTDDTGFSNGTSEYINAVDGGLNKTYTEFTFTGTGFDLISRTGVNAGMIQAQIYQGPEVTDTVYKKATVANVGASELYQIPVLSCEGMEYGTYTVRIQVFEAYEDAIIPALSRGGEFYFDAVRIYDPINVEGAELTGDSQIAQTAYEADTEAYVQHMEIRDAIISSSQFDSTDADAEGEGVVYIDATQTSAIESSDSATVIDYDMAGPNNELYLKYSSTSVGFILYTDHIPESLQIGAKSALGGYVSLDASIQNPTDEEVLAFNSAEFNHATAQNYSTFVDDNDEIVTDYSKYFNETQDGRYYTYVFISNLADDEDQILSITDIKATFAEPSSMSFGYSTALLAAFNNRLQSETPDIPSEPTGPQLISADFTTDTIRYVKKAELQVITSADVEKVVVLDEDGDDMKPTLDPQMDENGNKTWALNFKVGKPGTHSFTVYGVDKDGNQTSTATVSIEATRK